MNRYHFNYWNKIFGLLFTVGTLFLSACGQEGGGVQSVEKTGPNADRIHNPATVENPFDTTQLARIRYDEVEFDFGRISEGEKVEHIYRFTNTSQVPLIIRKARSSCGCTVAEWPEDPIPPGGQGELLVTFDSENRPGEVKKSVHVLANTYPQETTVILKGMVETQK